MLETVKKIECENAMLSDSKTENAMKILSKSQNAVLKIETVKIISFPFFLSFENIKKIDLATHENVQMLCN